MEKSETNIGKFLKENKAIFNYIYDSRGFKIGVVVAKKGDYIGHNQIGWALFDEIEFPSWTQLVRLKDTPIYKDMMEAFKESVNIGIDCLKAKDTTSANVLKDTKVLELYDAIRAFDKAIQDTSIYSEDGDRDVPAYYYVDKGDVLDTIKRALEKANYDSWNYYCLKHEDHDLRNDIVDTYDTGFGETERKRGKELPVLANNLRKAIRKMEFRAWRYFK